MEVQVLVGSLLIFSKGINPAVAHISRTLGNNDFSFAEHVIYVVYHANWIVPVCALCYACSSAWYQELADSSYKFLRGMPKEVPVLKTLTDGTYATVAWVMVFLQVQLSDCPRYLFTNDNSVPPTVSTVIHKIYKFSSPWLQLQ